MASVNSLFLSLSLLITVWMPFTEAKNKCEPITIPLCKGIGYNMTSYPNFYGHEGQEEAGLEVHQFYPLVEVGCYKHLKFFLCSMYTPICQENYDKSVMPCREVCLDARKRCAPLMQQYGFKWPETLACDQLPASADQMTTGEICAAPPDALDDVVKDKAYKKKHQTSHMKPETDAAVQRGPISNYPVIGMDVVDSQCDCRCVKPFHVTSRSDNQVLNVSNCAYSCYSPALTKHADRQFMDTWITVWAGTCLLLSLFTILTFLIEMERFPYPERPIFYLSVCQLLVATGFLLRVYFGQGDVACDGVILKTGTSSNGGSCLLTFVLIYFFGMAASTWWVVLSLSWVLAAVPNWSTEWIGKYSTYFHIFAWTVPALMTALVIAFKAVDGDPLSGICYVGNTNVDNLNFFVLYPLLAHFVVGVFFLAIGFRNLWSIRSNLKNHQVEGTSKLTRLISKIGIFSFLYTVPAIFVILALFYEQHYRPLWEASQLCPCAAKISQNRDTSTILSLIKTASMLIVGWTSGVWVISGKTVQSWKNFFCCCSSSRTRHQPLVNHKYQTSHEGIPYMHASTDVNTLNHGYYLQSSTHTSPLNKYQQSDVIFANHECISPLIYPSNGTLKHSGRILPQDV